MSDTKIINSFLKNGRRIESIARNLPRATPALSFDQATLMIDYLTDTTYTFPVWNGGRDITVRHLFREIRRAYSHIYRYPARYGVWGHFIDQLWLEGVRVFESHNGVTIKLGVGS